VARVFLAIIAKVLMDKSKTYRHGFTFIEVMIAISIITILSTVSLASYGLFNQRKKLDSSADQFKQVLELAKKKAVASDKSGLVSGGVDYSTCNLPSMKVNITSASSYVLTANVCDNTGVCPLTSGCLDIPITTYTTDAPILISPASGTIQFDSISKTASGLSTVTFTHTNLNQQVMITIDSSGIVY
jgi:prepilin-type N-terminal cleavage/methylation domain-containing protein